MISLVFASRSATLTDATDLVTTANNHGFSANNQIRFLTIVNTTGISTNTWYYVANNASLTANTFQLTASAGSAVLPLTTNGTGTIDIPISPIVTPKTVSYIKPKWSTINLIIKKFSPVKTSAISSAKARLTNLVSELVSISSIQSVNVISCITPYWSTIKPIIIKISSVTNLPAVVSFIPNNRFIPFEVLFSPINTANISSTVVKITSIISEFVKISFVTTMQVVTRKLPDPRTTWANVTQQVKTLIQFWS